MAILSNINGKFAVDSTGAIQLSGSAGTANYVLVSGGAAAAPTWVAGSTVIGGPYLPLSGGTLTGATATATGISFTVGGTLTGTSATFSGSVTSNAIPAFIVGTIGAIGNTANDVNIYSTTAGHNGLRMHVNGILPTNNAGTIIDNDADLGDPSYRFKDLYLGGSITAGGGATFGDTITSSKSTDAGIGGQLKLINPHNSDNVTEIQFEHRGSGTAISKIESVSVSGGNNTQLKFKTESASTIATRLTLMKVVMQLFQGILGQVHLTLTANTNFDNLIIEGSAHTGITIFSGTSSDGAIYFGDSGANNLGQIKYAHGSNAMTFATNDGAASLTLDSGLNATFQITVNYCKIIFCERKWTSGRHR